jgi:hypothetical protein
MLTQASYMSSQQEVETLLKGIPPDQRAQETDTLIVEESAWYRYCVRWDRRDSTSSWLNKEPVSSPATSSGNGDSRMYRKDVPNAFFSKMQAQARSVEVEEISAREVAQQMALSTERIL